MAKMLKAIHAQENKKAARETAAAVVAEPKSMKLPEAAKKIDFFQIPESTLRITLDTTPAPSLISEQGIIMRGQN